MAYTGYERYQWENRYDRMQADERKRRIDENIREDQLEYRKQRRLNKAKVEKFINDMPEGGDFTSLPSKYDKALNAFLENGKDKYYQHAQEIMKYEPGTDGYRYHKDGMTAVKNAYKTAKAQTDLFGSNKVDLGTDVSTNTFSKGNDLNEMNLLTSVYTDEYDMVFNDDGTIGFDDGNGNVYQFNELPDYFNKDFKTSDAIQKMGVDLYKAGVPLNDATRQMYRYNLRSMLEQGGTETLYSLATDDFFNQGGLGIPNYILKDPNRRDEVEEMVIDSYMNVLESQANAGSVYSKKSTSGGGGVSSKSHYAPSVGYDGDRRYEERKPKDPNGKRIRYYEDGEVVYIDKTGKIEVVTERTGGTTTTSTPGEITLTDTEITTFAELKKANPTLGPKELAKLALSMGIEI